MNSPVNLKPIRKERARKADAPAGFTLVELIAVIALLSLLAVAVAPGLAALKPNCRSIQCRNNFRQLMGAWIMYAGDHSGQVVNNFGIAATQGEISSGTYQSWANNSMSWDSNAMNTNKVLLAVGPLSPYLNNQTSVFRCPADDYVSKLQQSLGWTSRTRSVSMNGLFGRFSQGNDVTAVGLSFVDNSYAAYLKLVQVQKPSKTWVMLDEHPDSINDGYFIVFPTSTYWGDIPGSNHNGGCGLGFADGHAEIKQWLSTTSKLPVHFTYLPANFDPAGRADFQWLLQRTGYVNAHSGAPAFGY